MVLVECFLVPGVRLVEILAVVRLVVMVVAMGLMSQLLWVWSQDVRYCGQW